MENPEVYAGVIVTIDAERRMLPGASRLAIWQP